MKTVLLRGLLALGALTMVPTALAWEGEEDESDAPEACSQTTHAAFRACRNDVRDTFWTEQGICFNVSDAAERRACEREARLARRESRGECADQREARDDVCDALGEAPYDPEIPEDLVSPEMAAANPNPYFPLTPGLVKIFQSEEEQVVVTVTDRTREIDGVETIVVRDVVSEFDPDTGAVGDVIEDTEDYYAQDSTGNVYYFGEIARNFEAGHLVDLDGSWRSGVDGSKFGVQMFASPQVGQIYRQEWALTEAEDMAEVVALNADANSAWGECVQPCLQVREFTPIEPGIDAFKFYSFGIGVVLESEGADRLELVEVIQP